VVTEELGYRGSNLAGEPLRRQVSIAVNQTNMSEYYTDITCNEALKCSAEDTQALIKALIGEETPESFDGGTGLRAVHQDSCFAIEVGKRAGQVYFFAERYADVDQIPEAFLQALSALLRKLGRNYLEFGIAYTGSKHDPGSHGGGNFRIYHDGTLRWPEQVWEE
jgi:hypothetical protein